MLKGLTSKVKKHITTVAYYGAKQAEEGKKIQAFLQENEINDIEVLAALASVGSGESTADVAIEKIDAVLAKKYAEHKAAEDAAKKAAAAATKIADAAPVQA